MEKETNNGGSAFPRMDVTENGICIPRDGMTLRDYFAAKAMQADLTHQGLEGREDLLHVAGMAYQVADAMLKAREVK